LRRRLRRLFRLERLAQQRVDIDRAARLLVRRTDQQHDFPARRMRLVVRDQLGGAAAAALLVELGQLAGDRKPAPGQDLADRRERFRQPRRGLEEHQRRAHAAEFGQHVAPRLVLRRQEAREQEPVARQPRQRQRHDRRARARQAGHGDPRRACLAHEAVAGIRHQRGSGVADQRHRLVMHRG
jgi:hypothetical protein